MFEKRIMISILIAFSVTVICASYAIAYDDQITHRDLTEEATKKSALDSYLIKNLGFAEGLKALLKNGVESKKIIDWLKKGSTDEDSPMCRASNHFHNPLLPLSQSYVTDDPWWFDLDIICAVQKPFYSSVTWGTGYLSPSPTGTKIPISNQEWSWNNARSYYYLALT